MGLGGTDAVSSQQLYKDWTYMPLLNATVSVDTFFVMSGALMAYNLLKELDRSKGRLNYPMLVLHRFLRYRFGVPQKSKVDWSLW